VIASDPVRTDNAAAREEASRAIAEAGTIDDHLGAPLPDLGQLNDIIIDCLALSSSVVVHIGDCAVGMSETSVR